jgi:hypothetical protein
MNPELRLRTEQIIMQHPNVMWLLFRNIKPHLPLGIGEEKVKGCPGREHSCLDFQIERERSESLRGSTAAGSRVLPLPAVPAQGTGKDPVRGIRWQLCGTIN